MLRSHHFLDHGIARACSATLGIPYQSAAPFTTSRLLASKDLLASNVAATVVSKRPRTPISVSAEGERQYGEATLSRNRPDVARAQAVKSGRKDASKHHDLHTYLAHVKRHNVQESPSHTGTLYEYRVADTLIGYDFVLEHKGGKNDRGIDLRGVWHLPGPPGAVPVIIQCKAGATSAAHMRDLIGTVSTARGGTLAIMASSHQPSKTVIGYLAESRLPLAFIQISREGIMRSMVLNAATKEILASGISIREKITLKDMEQGGKASREVTLLWEGKRWPKKME